MFRACIIAAIAVALAVGSRTACSLDPRKAQDTVLTVCHHARTAAEARTIREHGAPSPGPWR